MYNEHTTFCVLSYQMENCTEVCSVYHTSLRSAIIHPHIYYFHVHMCGTTMFIECVARGHIYFEVCCIDFNMAATKSQIHTRAQ